MTEIIFNHQADGYYDTFIDNVQERLAGLFLPDENPPMSLPHAEAWERGGIYLFFKEELQKNISDFIAELRGFLDEDIRDGARLIWIPNPNRLPLDGYFLGVWEEKIDRRSQIPETAEQALDAFIGMGCPIEPDELGWRIINLAPHTIEVIGHDGASEVHDGDLAIRISDDVTGKLMLNFTIHHPAAWGILFAYEYKGGTLTYPIYTDGLPLQVRICDLHGEDKGKSFPKGALAFRQDDSSAFYNQSTYFRTIHGHTVFLKATENCYLHPLTSRTGRQVYVPDGDFAVSIQRDGEFRINDFDRIICGSAGTECLFLEPTTDSDTVTNFLCFRASGKGYSPEFRKSGRPRLTDTYKTAWCWMRRSDGFPITYFAQPEVAGMYKPIDGSDTMLEYFEIPAEALTLPAGEEIKDGMFPMVPYAGLTRSQFADAHRFETEVLSRIRREQIRRLADNQSLTENPEAANVTVVTPQGLKATFTKDYNTLTELQLAKFQQVGSRELFTLKNMGRTDALRTALQSQKLFLVATNADALSRHFAPAENILYIAEWGFSFDNTDWKQSNTIFILKFREQKLTTLVDNLALWSLPEEFNVSSELENIQFRLREIFQGAIAAVATDTDENVAKWGHLAALIDNENWTGVLAFQVAVPPQGLPPQLQGLACGLNEPLIAQYVAIETTPTRIENAAGQHIINSHTATFGLIDMKNNKPPANYPIGTEGYQEHDFRVLLLTVIFRNSSIDRFACEIGLKVDSFIGEEVQIDPPSRDGFKEIFLTGRHQNVGGMDQYTFSLMRECRFLMKNSVLNHVSVSRATFVTDSTPIGSGTRSFHFGLSGRWDFAKLGDFDILSFGADGEDPSPKQTLQYNNLRLTFHATLTGDSCQTTKTFFDVENMTLNTARSISQPRKNSLYEKFPLRLMGMISDRTQDLDTLGFLEVKTPLKGSVPGSDWYALTYDLEIGSMGSLANDARLKVGLLAAWNAGSDNLYVGLKLPGSNGLRELSLQGIFKITFELIRFEVRLTGSNLENAAYVLMLKNIMLHVLAYSFPPSAQTAIVILGDPEAVEADEEKTLGWYASYARTKGMPES
ncbi:MAG: hypothetical protein K8I82_08410 [Anaerolineae bacterium]|nr:hypothetical protein [Anaerolineae bacterium]